MDAPNSELQPAASRDSTWQLPATVDAMAALEQRRTNSGFMAAAINTYPTSTQKLHPQDNTSLNTSQAASDSLCRQQQGAQVLSLPPQCCPQLEPPQQQGPELQSFTYSAKIALPLLHQLVCPGPASVQSEAGKSCARGKRNNRPTPPIWSNPGTLSPPRQLVNPCWERELDPHRTLRARPTAQAAALLIVGACRLAP